MSYDIIIALRDLHKQATVERSHYYTGQAIEAAIAEITQLRADLASVDALEAQVAKARDDAWPELLPCTVEFGNVTVGRGCKTETLRLALMRAVDHAKRTPTDAEPSKGEGCVLIKAITP